MAAKHLKQAKSAPAIAQARSHFGQNNFQAKRAGNTGEGRGTATKRGGVHQTPESWQSETPESNQGGRPLGRL